MSGNTTSNRYMGKAILVSHQLAAREIKGTILDTETPPRKLAASNLR
jgi:hypothetical protein